MANVPFSPRDFADAESFCRELEASTRGQLAWEWEDRFQVALATFDYSRLDQVLRLLIGKFGCGRAREDLLDAPHRLRRITDYLGGMERGQILFATDPEAELVIFAAWWPHGDGKTIALRVGLFAPRQADASRVRDWFAISTLCAQAVS